MISLKYLLKITLLNEVVIDLSGTTKNIKTLMTFLKFLLQDKEKILNPKEGKFMIQESTSQ